VVTTLPPFFSSFGQRRWRGRLAPIPVQLQVNDRRLVGFFLFFLFSFLPLPSNRSREKQRSEPGTPSSPSPPLSSLSAAQRTRRKRSVHISLPFLPPSLMTSGNRPFCKGLGSQICRPLLFPPPPPEPQTEQCRFLVLQVSRFLEFGCASTFFLFFFPLFLPPSPFLFVRKLG